MKKLKVFFSALTILVSAAAFGQKITVKGSVTDASTGEAVPFVALQEKGTMNGSTTDANGGYTISVPANATLVFTSIGYEAQEVEVGGRAVIDISLAPDSELLQETIVVAFGTATKESFTGSAKVVDSDALQTSQVTNAVEALKGKVSGVQISQSTGSPADDGITMRIRGFSSINAGQSPLIVLDGIPYEGSMSTINPNDIESMTVIKDASAAALYGARGSNGVVMVTTKKGTGRKAVVKFDGKVGINSRAIPQYDYIRSVPGYYETHYKALYNSYISAGKTAEEAHLLANNNVVGPKADGGLVYQVYTVPEGEFFIGYDGKVNPNATIGRKVTTEKDGEFYLQPDDWTKAVIRNAVRQDYNVSISGGSEKNTFYASIGYLDNQGILVGTSYDRITARLNADYRAKDWLKVGANVAYAHAAGRLSDEDGVSNSSGNVFALTTQVAPIYPLYVRDGKGNIKVDGNGLTVYDYGDKSNAGLERPVFTGTNALGDHLMNTQNFDVNAFTGNAFADFTFLKDFKFSLIASTSVAGERDTQLTNAFYGTYKASNGILYKYHTRDVAYELQQLLTWKHKFNSHNFDVMLGHEYNDVVSAYLYASKNNMFSPDNLELAGAVKENGSNSYTNEYNTEGFFGRIQYDFDERIFLSASYRRDASSRFHPDYRWGDYWTGSAAWIISKENWFNASWVDYLKLKASYGTTGNDNIGNYRYTDVYDIRNSAGNVSLVLNNKGAKDITWEKDGKMNAGVEFELWKKKVSGSIEGFYNKTVDMLSWFTVPPSLGYSGYWANIGDMVNKGVEFEVVVNPVHTSRINWEISANITAFKNEIVKLADSRKTTTTPEGYKGYQSGNHFYGEGLPLYSFYIKQYAGVDRSTGLPMWYQDVEIDGKMQKVPTTNYSNATFYVSGNPIPKAYGGFGTTLDAYGFDLTVNFSYQIGGKIYDSGYATAMASPTSSSLGNNYHTDVLKAWTPENPDSNIPRWQYGDLYNASSCDRFLTDGSYLSLDTIDFGYTLPGKLTKKAGIEKLRIYAACQNVWLWSRRQGFDPRLSFDGSNNATTYSAVRTISGGINITF